MAFFLPRLVSKPVAYGLGIGLTSSLLLHHRPFSATRSSILYCDDSTGGSTSPKDWSFGQYTRDARTPVVKEDGGLNPRAVRQLTRGSIFGVMAGLAVSMFSKSLALLLGLLIVGVQTAESYNIHIIPYNRLQRYVTSVNLRSFMQDNAAFKLSFGATFALAGFARFSDGK